MNWERSRREKEERKISKKKNMYMINFFFKKLNLKKKLNLAII